MGKRGKVEWAQRFVLTSNSTVVSAKACFRRPTDDPNRSLDFTVRFYSDTESNRVGYPGQRGGLAYNVESDIRRAGTHRCVVLQGALVGKTLSRGAHWIGVEWNTDTQKRLGGDHYTADDPADTDRNNDPVFKTEVRSRSLPVTAGSPNEGWTNPRRISGTNSGLKAIGVSLVVAPVHVTDPDPDPDPDPSPPANSLCNDGLCRLADGRFRVIARYAMPGMSSQSAGTISAGLGGAAGLFTFGGEAPELMVRMVDDCSASGYWMLYTGAATDANYSIAVRDTTTRELKWFRGRGGVSLRESMAFACGN